MSIYGKNVNDSPPEPGRTRAALFFFFFFLWFKMWCVCGFFFFVILVRYKKGQNRCLMLD